MGGEEEEGKEKEISREMNTSQAIIRKIRQEMLRGGEDVARVIAINAKRTWGKAKGKKRDKRIHPFHGLDHPANAQVEEEQMAPRNNSKNCLPRSKKNRGIVLEEGDRSRYLNRESGKRGGKRALEKREKE